MDERLAVTTPTPSNGGHGGPIDVPTLVWIPLVEPLHLRGVLCDIVLQHVLHAAAAATEKDVVQLRNLSTRCVKKGMAPQGMGVSINQ
jgi:hypothetical protein